jgi:predicted house-cleaning noncanonical NTP pyrophosphatase (MazG superfamily)
VPNLTTRSRKIRRHLEPNRRLIVIQPAGTQILEPESIDGQRIGQKAYGLLLLPPSWTLPFFVVTADAALALSQQELRSRLENAADQAEVPRARVLVRSNGIREGLRERGKLPTEASGWGATALTLAKLSQCTGESERLETHWIVQAEESVKLRGQLSNERRLRYDKRDWVIETELDKGQARSKQTSIAVRRWRDGNQLDLSALHCDSELKVSLALKRVAMWAGQDDRRFLFEWLWNGQEIKIVQMDVADDARGVVPKSLLPNAIPQTSASRLLVFREAQPEDYLVYRKLANAHLYRTFGYDMPPFYVLDEQNIFKSVLQGGPVPVDVVSDLRELTARPLILRTDGTDIPTHKREMLPRSEELRNEERATKWITNEFRNSVSTLGLGEDGLCVIGHHFLPALASAWAGASPGRRWVRIEALWGIPESLYWYPHDTFEIDTERADLSRDYSGKVYPIRSKKRFKGIFIAPDADGAWITHETAPPDDWNPTIRSERTLSEIAHTTRRICDKVGKSVQVMWFVGVHQKASRHDVLPWYHSTEAEEGTPTSAPRKKIKISQERYIRNHKDWTDLETAVRAGERVERIIVEPSDPEIIRNQDFATKLGALAHQNRIVVVLAGGILSHAYYALRRSGAAVECLDLYGANEERTEFNKVVRDKVPSQIADRGEQFEVVKLEGDALNVALRRKLVEEALETLDAKDGTEILAELADVVEVVKAITRAMQITEEQLEEERARKEQSRGGFNDSLMLLRTATPFSISPAAPIAVSEFELRSDVQKVITNPAELPHKPVYKRPDRRSVAASAEELLVIETELNRLGSVSESSSFELPPNLDSIKYVSTIELSRDKGAVRAAIRLTPKENTNEDDPQLAFTFDPSQK